VDVAVRVLAGPTPTAKRPLFTELRPAACWCHIPRRSTLRNAPLLALLTELMEAAKRGGRTACGHQSPSGMAAMTMADGGCSFSQHSGGGLKTAAVHPITADEVWDFCSHGFAAS